MRESQCGGHLTGDGLAALSLSSKVVGQGLSAAGSWGERDAEDLLEELDCAGARQSWMNSKCVF